MVALPASPLAPADTNGLPPWLARPGSPRRRGSPTAAIVSCWLRFAFYGRISTIGYQDPSSSRLWQVTSAADLIAGHGIIFVEYLDYGCSRSRSWADRPQAARLLADLADPDRGFDAIVVGEYERAFDAGQVQQLMPLLHQHGVALWLPETGGPVDTADPAHQALLMQLGAQSHREVLRSRFRTTAAMRAQAKEQGRHLGGRPPYGYRLVDAGPHPNAVHAAWGRRLHRLDPDPVTAPTVQWIFTQRLAGHSTAHIARTLNDQGVPCPAAHDRARNPHRSGQAWTLRTVAEILTNPRYTDHQVWGRQRTDHPQPNPGTGTPRGKPVRRWNPPDQWAISTQLAHPALISEADFAHAQTVSAVAGPADGQARQYRLTGLLLCRDCGRRLEAHWVHGHPGYRCRHGHTSAHPSTAEQPRFLYLREATLLTRIAALLGERIEPNAAPAAVAGYLHARGLTITCDPTTTTIDEPTYSVAATGAQTTTNPQPNAKPFGGG